jgi:hypothetical protein
VGVAVSVLVAAVVAVVEGEAMVVHRRWDG